MSQILDDAEQRIVPAAAAAQTRQREIVASMREEIGRQHYEHATVELPKLEQFIAKQVRPYVDRLMRLSHHAPAPLPPRILEKVRELQEGCASGTDWVRAGIDEWDRLAPPFVPGTQQLDTRRRTAEVDSLRKRLRNWDGRQARLRELMAHIDDYIKDTAWPSGHTGSPTLAPAPPREAEEINVEI
jgi:hypothetical protein